MKNTNTDKNILPILPAEMIEMILGFAKAKNKELPKAKGLPSICKNWYNISVSLTKSIKVPRDAELNFEEAKIFTKLENLNLSGYKFPIGYEFIDSISTSFSKLKKLNLTFANEITDDGMVRFSKLTNLEYLNLYCAKCDIDFLPPLPNLRKLIINKKSVSLPNFKSFEVDVSGNLPDSEIYKPKSSRVL